MKIGVIGVGNVGKANVKGFLCEPADILEAVDITSHGGWRDYLEQKTTI